MRRRSVRGRVAGVRITARAFATGGGRVWPIAETVLQSAVSPPPLDLDPGLLRRLAGKFLVFDGPDGSGKSTQFRLLADAARGAGLGVLEVREPGGTAIGEDIRDLLLRSADGEAEMDVVCEALLFMASRAQLVRQRIEPALAAGQLVLADRFVSSTFAYQGAAGGIPEADLRELARITLRGCAPDLVLLLDVDPQTASRRLNPLLDRIEARDAAFHERVRQGFLRQAADDPERFITLDAARTMGDVTDQLTAALRHWLSP